MNYTIRVKMIENSNKYEMTKFCVREITRIAEYYNFRG